MKPFALVVALALQAHRSSAQECASPPSLLVTTSEAIASLTARVQNLAQSVSVARSHIGRMQNMVANGQIQCPTSDASAMGLPTVPRCIRSGIGASVCFESSNADCEACIQACPNEECYPACRFEGSSDAECRALALGSDSLAAGCDSLSYENRGPPDCVSNQVAECDASVDFEMSGISKLTGVRSMTLYEQAVYRQNATCNCYRSMDLSLCDSTAVIEINTAILETCEAAATMEGYPSCVDPSNIPGSVCPDPFCVDAFTDFVISAGQFPGVDPLLIRHIVVDNMCFSSAFADSSGQTDVCLLEPLDSAALRVEQTVESLMIASRSYGPSACNARVLVRMNATLAASYADYIGSVTIGDMLYSTLDHRTGLDLQWTNLGAVGSNLWDGNCTVPRYELGCAARPLPLPPGWELASPGPESVQAAQAHCWDTEHVTAGNTSYTTISGVENPSIVTTTLEAELGTIANEIVNLTDAMICQSLEALSRGEGMLDCSTDEMNQHMSTAMSVGQARCDQDDGAQCFPTTEANNGADPCTICGVVSCLDLARDDSIVFDGCGASDLDTYIASIVDCTFNSGESG
eukprot:SAG31_NODE_1143_length_9694_cov_5.541011_9_plen_578_part_00